MRQVAVKTTNLDKVFKKINYVLIMIFVQFLQIMTIVLFLEHLFFILQCKF